MSKRRCFWAALFNIDVFYFVAADDQQKMVRRQKIQENRMRRSGVPMAPGSLSDYAGMMQNIPTPVSQTESSPSATSPFSATGTYVKT